MFEDKSMFQFYSFNSDYYKFLYNFNTKSEKKKLLLLHKKINELSSTERSKFIKYMAMVHKQCTGVYYMPVTFFVT